MTKDSPMATSHAETIIVKNTTNCDECKPVAFENNTKNNPTPASISSKQSMIDIKSFLKIVPINPRQKRNVAK